MGALIRAYDWKPTPFGDLGDWPQTLRTCLQTVLNARSPMAIYWGGELYHFYNDTYARVMLGKDWQGSLGRPAADVWREQWRELGPLAKGTLRTGRPERTNTLRLTLERGDLREEGYRRISYSALPGRPGEIAGVLCCVTVETQNVVRQRREGGLHSLSISTMTAQSTDEAWRASVAALAKLSDDLPFFLLYAADPVFNGCFLAGAGHVAEGTAGCPRILDLNDPHAPWPLRAAHERQRSIVIDELPGGLVFLGERRPEPARRAVLLPIICAREVIGFAIMGLNPRQPFDEDYRKYLERLASYLACAIASARAAPAGQHSLRYRGAASGQRGAPAPRARGRTRRHVGVGFGARDGNRRRRASITVRTNSRARPSPAGALSSPHVIRRLHCRHGSREGCAAEQLHCPARAPCPPAGRADTLVTVTRAREAR